MRGFNSIRLASSSLVRQGLKGPITAQRTAVRAGTQKVAIPSMQRVSFHGFSFQSMSENHDTSEPSDPSASASSSFDDPRLRILDESLTFVNSNGWKVESLALGARNIGYPSVAHGMFPRGSIELVEYFMEKCNREMSEKMTAASEELRGMSVKDRLKFGIKTRLELIGPYLSNWPEAMAHGALPQNAATTMKSLAVMADEIWYHAGDQSNDISWYSKRAMLTGVYASAELFMLTDQSLNYEETWNFVDRRLEEVIHLGELPQNTQELVGMIGAGAQALFSATTSLAGPLMSETLKRSAVGSMANSVASGVATMGSQMAGKPQEPVEYDFNEVKSFESESINEEKPKEKKSE